MKFLHTADIHYGAAPDPGRPWAKERAQAVRDGFDRVISACKTENVDLLIISGGLFDGHPSLEWIEGINRGFESIPGTHVYIVSGEDDVLFVNSPVANYKWADNVEYNLSTDLVPSVYKDIVIAGVSCDKPHFAVDKLKKAAADPDRASVLVFSGAAVEEADVPAGFTYVAQGGSHKPLVMRDGALVNAGAPEPLGPEDTGKHGFYVGEIEGGKLTALKFLRQPGVSYITLAVNVTPSSGNEEAVANIRKALEKRGEKNIYRIRLKGRCNPENRFDLSSICNDFRIDEIIDETEPEYDYVKLFREHPSDMIGFFVKDMNVEDRSELQTKALNYGVAALLRTADERE